MSLFGSFGNTQNAAGASTATPGTNLFGGGQQQQQQQQPTTNLFGTPNPQQNQAQPSTNLFGAPSAQQNAGQPSTGLFGNTQQQQQQAGSNAPGGGLFGGGAQNTGGGLFGGGGAQQQQPAAGGGLFGNTAGTTNQQPTGGGLFGNTSTTNASQQPTTSLFGNTAANTATQQQPTNSLFGNTSANTANQQPGGGLFGNTATTNQQAGGGLFGGTNTANQQNTTSLFGNTQPQQQQQQPTNSLFGNTTNQSNGSSTGLFGNKPGGLFGQGGLSINTNTTAPTTTNTTNSLFGGSLGQSTAQQQPQQQQQQGQAGTSSLFGQQQQQQKPGLFGSTSTAPGGSGFGGNQLGQSTFGQSTLGQSTLGTGSLLSRPGAGPSPAQGDSPQAQFARLMQQIEGLANSWNAQSPDCRFQHYFYNLVNPNQVAMYGRPPNVTNEALWQKALRENPDATCMVPVLAVGFDDLRQRVEAQSRKATEHQEQLKELKSRLSALSQRHSLSNTSRVQRATAAQTQLTHRLLGLVQHLHLLIPALRSSAIRPEEEELRGQLEDIEEELRRGRGKAKVNELWALLGAINAAKERNSGAAANGEWVVVDDEGFAQIAQVLAEQQAGLMHLTKILQKAMKDLKIVMGQSTGGADEVYEVDRDELWGSTSTLRGSTSFHQR